MRPSDLTVREDFRIGPLDVSPARRRVGGPGGEVQLEPVVMQVFLMLLDDWGRVVTRDALFQAAWGGAIVGDDSLNRAIAVIRRIGTQVAPGLFRIETIPRTGYRLIGDTPAPLKQEPAQSDRLRPVPRRAVIAGGLAVAGVGGLAIWWADSRDDQKFDDLISAGEQVLGYGDPSVDASKHFRRAVALRPNDSRALGLLAYSRALSAERGDPEGATAALQEAERATRAALALDANDPNARLASILLQRSVLDFAATEDRLRQVLAAAPSNTFAMRHLWNLLQCVGRSRDALDMVEQAIGVAPLAAAHQYPRAQLLWILGRTAEADRVIDSALGYWPSHRFVRFARFMIFAFTNRPRAALAMLEKEETAPQIFSAASIALWRVSLPALDGGSPSTIADAKQANLKAATANLQLASQAISTLSLLGDVDAAFTITDALFAINRSPERLREEPVVRPPVTSAAWRFAPWLFTPPTAPLRSDGRFEAICDQIGLSDYWKSRRIKPDYQVNVI